MPQCVNLFSPPFVFCFFLAFSVSAQTDLFLANYRELIAKNPKDVSFTVSIKNNKTEFRQGEIISLELKFSSSGSGIYSYLSRTYDRSGRLHLDGFIVDKKDETFDPLYDYFFRNRGDKIVGGLFNTFILGSKPHIMNYELNEFMSFKEPGRYRLYISSPRVSLNNEEKKEFSSAFGEDSVSLVSNIVEFEILPAEKEWQAKKLAEAVGPVGVTQDGCKILRFLGTKVAAKEMLRRFSRDEKNCRFENYIGLYGSPERKFIVDEMKKMLVSPDFAVTDDFFRMLLNLDFFLNNPEHKKSEENIFGFETDEEKESKNAIKLQYLEKLSIAIPNKNKSAFSESLETFFSNSAEGEKQAPAELTNALTSSFSKLSKETQWLILKNSWNKLKNPAMLPVLQDIYNSFGKTGLKSARVTNETFEDTYDSDLLYLSIEGIYELDPNLGKQIILYEIGLPKQRVYSSVLTLLHETESAETVNLLLEKLAGANIPNDDLYSVFILINHYQTPELLLKLRENYADRIDTLECNARLAFLTVFLKTDIDFGTKMLEKAMNDKAEKDCRELILANAIEPHWSPEIERIILDALESENLYVYNNAVNLLGKHGSKDIPKKLWKRFERFNKAERSKPNFLENKENLNDWRVRLAELDFAIALFESPNWLLDSESIRRLSELCLYEPCKQKAEELKNIFGTPVKIESASDEKGQLLFSVYQYKKMSLDSLKKKLRQFPPDTTFTWISNRENPNDEKHFVELKEFVKEYGMFLTK
jgi:hypothetical protein